MDPGRPVICAYEDNPIARHALGASAWLAHALDTPLVMAHALDATPITVLPTREMARRSIDDEDLEHAGRERARRRLAAAAAPIVTATRERNELGSALPGSVSTGVVGIPDRPVGLVSASVREPPA